VVITNYMAAQSLSGDVNSHSANQKILRLLWNTQVHYRVHNASPMVPIMSHKNLIHTFQPYFSEIHSNIIPSSMPRLSTDLPLNPSHFVNHAFLRWEVISPPPNPQATGPSHVSCPRLLIKFICSYLHIWRSSPSTAT